MPVGQELVMPRILITSLGLAFCWAFTAASAPALAETPLTVQDLLKDHAVLQRERPIQVSGRAAPAESITASFAGQSAAATADNTGRWNVSFPAMPAGGPYSLEVKSASGQSRAIADILVGDVWLCSGQSNMVLQVHRSLNSRSEIANAANDSIRMATVDLTTSLTPLESFKTPVTWLPAGPKTVPDFSAACFYFARELQKTVPVPMGLITSAWGGSKIEAWMSGAALRSIAGYDSALALLKIYSTDRAKAGQLWGEAWEAWWRSRPLNRASNEPWREISSRPNRSGQSPRTPDAASVNWRKAPAMLGAWETWNVPELQSYDGLLWYRTSFTLSAKAAKQSATLSLGPVDEVDETWLNGRPVGNDSGAGKDRHYEIQRGVLHSGSNTVVVAALDTYGQGGMVGPVEKLTVKLADGTIIPLQGPWEYQLPPAGTGSPPRAPWEDIAGLTTIRNAMIAPIGSYGLRGALWYQGESNTDSPQSYERLLGALMADWRAQFGADLPFLVVQLANYGQAPTAPAESGWAEVREAQRLAVDADPHAGLAIAVDIGDRYDIHPANKQELGRRLARAARKVVYGENIATAGPAIVNARRQGDTVTLQFKDVGKELVTYSSDRPIGFELCGPEPNSCRYATATISGNQVMLDAAGSPIPTRVRYCWANSPVCTLYDRDNLPAGPFEVAIGP
jgi:sialate O-acetylesterase